MELQRTMLTSLLAYAVSPRVRLEGLDDKSAPRQFGVRQSALDYLTETAHIAQCEFTTSRLIAEIVDLLNERPKISGTHGGFPQSVIVTEVQESKQIDQDEVTYCTEQHIWPPFLQSGRQALVALDMFRDRLPNSRGCLA